jgi:hypothetical protein
MELAAALHRGGSGGLIVAAITRVYTIGYVAEMLGENEDWLHDIARVRRADFRRVDARGCGRYVQSRDEHEPEPTPT